MALREFPDGGTLRPALFDIARGDFAFVAGDMAKAGRLEIDTPFANIRGGTRVGGIGTLSLISLFFAAMEDVEGGASYAAGTDDETIPIRRRQRRAAWQLRAYNQRINPASHLC